MVSITNYISLKNPMLDISEVVVQGTPTYRGRVPCRQGLVSCVQFSSRVPPGSPFPNGAADDRWTQTTSCW